MHPVSLADLAASLAQHGPGLLEFRPPVPSKVILRYWVASRTRHELWHRSMAGYREAQREGDYREARSWWENHGVVLEEILVSELLARVVAAIGAGATDDPRDNEGLGVITHGVYLAQLEASNRVGRLLLEGGGAPVKDTVRLNRLRYGIERWSDWLIGRVCINIRRGIDYSVDEDRARSFSQELREGGNSRNNDTTTWLMNAAMREMLVRRTSEETAFGDANHEVASAALALFRPELFDDLGVPKSLWLQRLQSEATKMKPFDFAIASNR